MIIGRTDCRWLPSKLARFYSYRNFVLVSFSLLLSASAATNLLMAQTLVGRSPEEVAKVLLDAYGSRMAGNSYIQAVAVQGRMLLGVKLQRDDLLEQGLALTEPFVMGVKAPVFQSHSDLAGHLVFATAARHAAPQDRGAYTTLVTRAADSLFEPNSAKRIRLPPQGVMSDAVFMCGPLLCEAGSLSGQTHYYDAAIDYIEKVREQCVREDGLYRHSDLCDAAWGRGNGFPAIGIARCLDLMPIKYPGRETLLAAFRAHMSAIIPYQDVSGCWHQVVDLPESFPEFTCTAMIGWALDRGLKQNWVAGDSYQQAADRAWKYIAANTRENGEVQGACESTGKQKSAEDYLHRKAIFGKDDRSGAMALMFAHERVGEK